MSQIQVPKGWKITTIESISKTITKGSTPTTYGHNYTLDGIAFLRAENISNNSLNLTNLKYISEETHRFLKRSVIKSDDVLLTIAGTIGRAAAVPNGIIEMNSNQAVAIIRLKNDCLPRYLSYFLNSNLAKEQITGSKVTTSISNLSLTMIRKLALPLPSLETQKKIVQKLDYIFAQLEEKKKEILLQKEKTIDRILPHPKSFKNRIDGSDNLQFQIKRAMLNDAFTGNFTSKFRKTNFDRATVLNFCKKIEESIMSIRNKNKHRREKEVKFEIISKNDNLPTIPSEWVWANVASIEVFVGSGSTPKGGKSVYVKNGIPFIRSQNVHQEGLKLDDIAFITKEIHKQMSRTHTKPGDVLLNITGASIGRSTIVPLNFKEGNVNQHVCIIRASSWINPEYLSWWLNSSFIQNKIVEKQKGETREGLNYTHIRSLPVPITTLEEQNEIIHIINEKNKHADFIQSKLIDINELQEKFLKHANQIDGTVLDYAFSGKLVN